MDRQDSQFSVTTKASERLAEETEKGKLIETEKQETGGVSVR